MYQFVERKAAEKYASDYIIVLTTGGEPIQQQILVIIYGGIRKWKF